MVRYHWHVEDGHGAFIPPGSMAMHPCTHIQHALCEIQVPGQPGPNAEACFTVPMRHLNEGRVRDVGVILGHGDDAEEWQGPLLTQTAVALAQAGEFMSHSMWPQQSAAATYWDDHITISTCCTTAEM